VVNDGQPWAQVGAMIVHSTFGTGTVETIGDYKGIRVIWIDLDRGDRKPFEMSVVDDYTRLRTTSDRMTRPDPMTRCDVCRARPVVVTIGGSSGIQRFCDVHRSAYHPTRKSRPQLDHGPRRSSGNMTP
jgi:hypothetical protein